jgi:hypothetical protein
MKETTYHPTWQKNRINVILHRYGPSFFKNKTVLELAPCNGYIGNFFRELGADVLSVEGRKENINEIRINYPDLKVNQYDLDTPKWPFAKVDIILNFGLFYHLHNFHKEHLINCIDNCDMMLFESVIFDSDESEVFFKPEDGFDQSMSDIGGTPSTSYVEDIFKEKGCKFLKLMDHSLDSSPHTYTWPDTNNKIFNGFMRRFWIVNEL